MSSFEESKTFEESFERNFFNRLSSLKLSGGKSINTIQVCKAPRFPVLLSGPDMRVPLNIRDFHNLYGLDEFAQLIREKAQQEKEDLKKIENAQKKLNLVLDDFEKEIHRTIQEFRSSLTVSIIPRSLCSDFISNFRLDSSDEEFTKKLEEFCRDFEEYQKIVIPEDFDAARISLDQQVNTMKGSLETLSKQIKLRLAIQRTSKVKVSVPSDMELIKQEKVHDCSPHYDGRGIAYVPNSSHVLTMAKGIVKVIDTSTGSSVDTRQYNVGSSTSHSGVHTNHFGDGYVVHSHDKSIYVCDSVGTLLATFSQDHPSNIFACDYVGAENIACGYSGGHIGVWNIPTAKKIVTATPKTSAVYAICGLDEAGFLYGDDSGRMQYFDMRTRNVTWCNDHYHSTQISTIRSTYSPNPLIISGGNDKKVKCMDFCTKEVLFERTLDGNSFCLEWSPDASFILTCNLVSKKVIALSTTGEELFTSKAFTGWGNLKGMTANWETMTVSVVDELGNIFSYRLL